MFASLAALEMGVTQIFLLFSVINFCLFTDILILRVRVRMGLNLGREYLCCLHAVAGHEI